MREDVDWLGQHYRKLEGKRSGLAWFLFVTGLAVAGGGLVLMIDPDVEWPQRVFGAGLVVSGVASMSTISGRPATRKVMLLSSIVSTVLFTIATQQAWGALFGIPLLGLTATTWTDVRTRLFMRVPVPRQTLRKHYQREGSNPLAITASRLALLSLIIPGLSLVSLVLGVMALARIDSKAVPPVGNLSAALGAIVFSLFTSAIWGLNFFGS